MARNYFNTWSEEEVELFLAEHQLGQMGTIDDRGYPHVLPMWHTVFEHRLFISFRTAGKKKLANLKRNPKMSYTVDAGDNVNNYCGVMLQGEAEFITDPGLLARYHDAWLYRHFSSPLHPYYRMLTSVDRTVIRLNPVKVVSWDQRLQDVEG